MTGAPSRTVEFAGSECQHPAFQMIVNFGRATAAAAMRSSGHVFLCVQASLRLLSELLSDDCQLEFFPPSCRLLLRYYRPRHIILGRMLDLLATSCVRTSSRPLPTSDYLYLCLASGACHFRATTIPPLPHTFVIPTSYSLF